MILSVDIIKHGGQRQTEIFAHKKLYNSIVATCLSAQSPQGQAEEIAESVCRLVAEWLKNKPEVTSYDIRLVASKHLKVHHLEAAYLYEQHSITI